VKLARTLNRAQADEDLLSALESILLVAGEPVGVSALARALEQPQPQVCALLRLLQESLSRGIRLQLHNDQAQLVSAPENTVAVQRFLGAAKPAPISRAALEVLTVIAYRQPVTRAEVEAARGTNSDRAILTLLARDLIEERGQRQVPGRPMEFGTTFTFLEYFGLSSLDELPPIEENNGESMAAEELGLRPGRATSDSSPT
jgi:segregation and condensation protein B